MPLKFFTIPVRDTDQAEEELNGFLCSHRVLAVDRRWVERIAQKRVATGTALQEIEGPSSCCCPQTGPSFPFSSRDQPSAQRP
jgi:hypothetical protein